MAKATGLTKLTALSLSIAGLGGLWAYLALGPLAGIALVWVGFIAWGAYFHNGANSLSFYKTIAGFIFGSILAGVALALVGSNPLHLDGPIGPALYIAVTVFPLVFLSTQKFLSSVPANVYGYAATAGYALSKADAGSVTSLDLTNPVILVVIASVLGSIFGVLSNQLSAKIS